MKVQDGDTSEIGEYSSTAKLGQLILLDKIELDFINRGSRGDLLSIDHWVCLILTICKLYIAIPSRNNEIYESVYIAIPSRNNEIYETVYIAIPSRNNEIYETVYKPIIK